MFRTCPTCHERYTPGVGPPSAYPHKCPPVWLIWNPDEGQTRDDARPIYARDALAAVEKWAEQDDNDSAEYRIAQGHSATVIVQAPDGAQSRYKATGEYNPDYYAEQVE
jgi:hypothetical protein